MTEDTISEEPLIEWLNSILFYFDCYGIYYYNCIR